MFSWKSLSRLYFCLLSSNNVSTGAFQHINGMAQIKLAKYGSVDMDFVLGVGGYDLDRYLFLQFWETTYIFDWL